ncbi:MAG: hypothetical protein GC160_00970 [Acidobacteria bacterium]|nr:hypothetical protein [Acidobacteriota bacterium]
MRLLVCALLLAAALPAADHPSAAITNGLIEAKIHTPDPVNGYYRGTSFDWSGSIYSLTYKKHQYFGEWQQSDDPYLHDRITGPVEEYRPGDKGLGYAEAEPGGRFLRIGVGVCEKPRDEAEYDWRKSYKVVDPGSWSIQQGENWIEFIHQVREPVSGYAYRYIKRLTLVPGQPQLVIDHLLENTGTRPIETSVYNHNFFVIDGRPTGPEFVVKFPFDLTPDRDLKGYAAVQQKRNLVYLKEIPAGESIITLFDGFGATSADNAFVIENMRSHAAVRMSTDKPLEKMQFWSPGTTLCPEPYIALSIQPGQADRWTIHYEFFEIN